MLQDASAGRRSFVLLEALAYLRYHLLFTGWCDAFACRWIQREVVKQEKPRGRGETRTMQIVSL
jgi:hypothetical protein